MSFFLSHWSPVLLFLCITKVICEIDETCVEVKESQNNDEVVELNARCMLNLTKSSMLEATIKKYEMLQHKLDEQKNIFFYAVPMVKVWENPLDFLVRDTDIEVVSNGCPDQAVASEYYHIETGRAIHDSYNGYWHIEDVRLRGSRQWRCASAWFFVEAAFDPRLFYLRNTKYSKAWVAEMLTEMRWLRKRPHDEFSETHLFNRLLNRRLDKYMLIRKFPVELWLTDTCAMRWSRANKPENLNVAGRLIDDHVSARSRGWFDTKTRHRAKEDFTPLKFPQASQAINCSQVKDELCGLLDAIGTPMSTLLGKSLPEGEDEKVVGIVVIKGTYTKSNPIVTRFNRFGLEKYTICVCLDSAGCGSCTILGMKQYPVTPYLSVPTLQGPFLRELYNMFKYQIAYQILLRGYSVLSYDLDIVLLREPWPYFEDKRFDLFVSTDAHTAYWGSQSRTYDLWTYIRTSLNAGFWFARPTKEGKELFHRITLQHNATTSEHGPKVPYFFEQAAFSTVAMQSRCFDKPYCYSDARWKILSPTVLFNSKAAWMSEPDHAIICKGLGIHSNYGCPGTFMGEDKYNWLITMATNCGAQLSALPEA